jgi:serine/threonine protein kinase
MIPEAAPQPENSKYLMTTELGGIRVGVVEKRSNSGAYGSVHQVDRIWNTSETEALLDGRVAPIVAKVSHFVFTVPELVGLLGVEPEQLKDFSFANYVVHNLGDRLQRSNFNRRAQSFVSQQQERTETGKVKLPDIFNESLLLATQAQDAEVQEPLLIDTKLLETSEGYKPVMFMRQLIGENLSVEFKSWGKLSDAQLNQKRIETLKSLALMGRSLGIAGIVHRDLKPSNIMATPDGYRPIDYGMSMHRRSGLYLPEGMMAGTLAYAPFEVVASVNKSEYHSTTDQSALAIIVGQVLMNGRYLLEMENGKPKSLPGLEPDKFLELVRACMPDSIMLQGDEDMVLRLLQGDLDKDPTKRHADPTVVSGLLAVYLESMECNDFGIYALARDLVDFAGSQGYVEQSYRDSIECRLIAYPQLNSELARLLAIRTWDSGKQEMIARKITGKLGRYANGISKFQFLSAVYGDYNTETKELPQIEV